MGFLVLGALVNVAVAWGMSVHMNSLPSPSILKGVAIQPPDRWFRHLNVELPYDLPYAEISDSGIHAEIQYFFPPSEDYGLNYPRSAGWQTLKGWPFWSLTGGSFSRDASRDSSYIHTAVFVIDGYGYPLQPIWSGFIANTMIYSLILWSAWLGIGRARKYLRRRRGLCSMCAYDLRGADHESCPECGFTPC